MIDSDRWRVLAPLLDRALELRADEQAAWLAELRASSPSDAEALAGLLAREQSADRTGFLVGAPERPHDANLVGARFGGQYELQRELARGGMATVYLARDLRHGRVVAVKVLHPQRSAAVGATRFRREIEVTAALHHPHILPLFDSGEIDGRLYYVMPLVDGETLRARLTREGRLPVDDAVRLVREVADALAYAHTRGVVHRDVKPENILLQDGHALVSDFGIAIVPDHVDSQRVTRAGVSIGTPLYMAPEQVREQVVDARSDVYSLGVVLYELLAGEPPFTAPSAQALFAEVLTADPKPLLELRAELPHHVAAAVHTAIARDPQERFASASAFAAALAAPSPQPVVDTPAAGSARRVKLTGRRAWLLGCAAILGVILALGLDAGGVRELVTRRARAAALYPSAEQRSVAVLPFVNVGGQQADEYFSDGLTEELIARLSQLRSLRVAARTSSFAFKRQARDVREIARALNVASVLVGSVRTREGRIRVTAELVDATTGLDLWSGTYDERQLADVFGIQSDLALRIARALEANLSPSERGRIARRPTGSLEAYTLYLKGQFAWSERGEGLMTALEYFQRAIAIDSQYARAYAGLASAYLPLAVHGYIEPRAIREKARDAAARAVALDDSLAEAHTVLAAYLHVFEWDWAAAEREYRRAIALDPNEPTAHLWFGYMLEGLGRFDEAIVERQRAIDLDPLAPNSGLAAALRKAGRYDLAKAAYEAVVTRHPGYWQAHEGLAQTLEAMGAFTDAANEYERAAALAGHTARPTAGLARVLARAGQKDRARQLIAELRADAARTGNYLPTIATAIDAVGDRRAAIEWLETSYGQHHPGLIDIGDDDAYGALRHDPHFEDLRRRVGFGTTSTR